MWKKIQKWWYFRVQNPVVRKGEKGGFKWVFKRFWLDIETLSGNFKARFIADEHPYAYLLAGKDDTNIEGFCNTIYMVSKLLTTDQKFVDDIGKAVSRYEKRIMKEADVKEDETEEKIAIKEMEELQEHIELPKKERKKVERDINGRFKKAMKDVSEGTDSNV